MGFLDLFRRSPSTHESPGVRISDEAITHVRSGGTVETVRWDDLEEVGIITTSDGPFAEDVFWILLARDGETGCAIPASAAGMDALLPRLQRLADFDNEAVIRAMGCTTDARFVCWTKHPR